MTSENNPLSRAAAMVYASSGWPPIIRTFFRGTRFDPPRAGMSATAVGTGSYLSDARCIGDEIHVLQIPVNIERFRSGLPRAVARLFYPAKGHVGLAAKRARIYDYDPALNQTNKFHRAIDAAGVNAS